MKLDHLRHNLHIELYRKEEVFYLTAIIGFSELGNSMKSMSKFIYEKKITMNKEQSLAIIFNLSDNKLISF